MPALSRSIPERPPAPCRRIGVGIDPLDALRAWPAGRGLAALWSADPGSDPRAARWSRWTVLAEPRGCLRTVHDGGKEGAGGRGGGGGGGGGCRTRWHGPDEAKPRIDERADPLPCLSVACASTSIDVSRQAAGDHPPFVGGWIVSLGYELGRVLEPRACSRPRVGGWGGVGGWPLLLMHRCPGAYVHDRATGAWWAVGAAAGEPDPAWLRRVSAEQGGSPAPAGFEWSPPDGGEGASARTRYERGVSRVVEYIRAGDVFQANLAHTLGGRFSGSTRACFAEMVQRSAPWFGAYVEDAPPPPPPPSPSSPVHPNPRAAVASMSPELFLDFDPRTRRVVTRPIKGTRRGDAAPALLESSGKDHAELAMIVDLMRNDLGRVCEFGSMHVAEARAIERHAAGATGAGVWHGVATVQGTLRAGAGVADLLRATFPGGSITGAPKVRAMQVIDELEARPRGPYTGAIGYISDNGRACFNIAIRTALIEGAPAPGGLDQIGDGRWSYGVGAGIVAESDPAAEWDETLAKAEIALRPAPTPSHREPPCPTPVTA